MYLGANTGHDATFAPEALAAGGCNAVRIVLQNHVDLTDYCRALQRQGIAVFAVLAGESFAGLSTKMEALWHYALAYEGLLEGIQFGNEPEAAPSSNSSWVQSRAEVGSLIRQGCEVWEAADPGVLRIGPGLVSGHASYLDGMDLTGLHCIAPHPYAKWPTDVNAFLDTYVPYLNKGANSPYSLFVTEFGWPEPNGNTQAVWLDGMIEAMKAHPYVLGALVYCWDDSQNPNFGLNKKGKPKPALQSLKLHALPKFPGYATSDIETTNLVLGNRAFHDAAPALIGKPLKSERWPLPGFSQQPTTTGLLSWSAHHGHTFYHLATNTFYIFDPVSRRVIPV